MTGVSSANFVQLHAAGQPTAALDFARCNAVSCGLIDLPDRIVDSRVVARCRATLPCQFLVQAVVAAHGHRGVFDAGIEQLRGPADWRYPVRRS